MTQILILFCVFCVFCGQSSDVRLRLGVFAPLESAKQAWQF